MLKSDNFFVQYEYGLVRNHPADGNFSHPRHGRFSCLLVAEVRCRRLDERSGVDHNPKGARPRSGRLVCTPNTDSRKPHEQADKAESLYRRARARSRRRFGVRNQGLDVRGSRGIQNGCKPKKHPACLPRKGAFAADKRRSGETVGRGLARAAVHQHTRPDFDRRKIFEKRPCTNEKGML